MTPNSDAISYFICSSAEVDSSAFLPGWVRLKTERLWVVGWMFLGWSWSMLLLFDFSDSVTALVIAERAMRTLGEERGVFNLDRRWKWHLITYSHVERSPAYDLFTWAEDVDFRKQLRDATELEAELQHLPSEWHQILRLMDWVHHLSDHQGWDEAPELSALNLLSGVRSGKVTFRCVEFAHMLQQVCAAFGFPARVIGLRRPGSEEGFGKAHVVVDVWSNEYRKWIVLDAQMNSFYQSTAGEPLSAFQIHERVRTHRFDDLRMSRETEFLQEYEEQPAKDNITFEEFEAPDGFDREEAWDSLAEHGDFAGFMTFWKEYYYQLVFQTTYSLVRSGSTSGSDAGSQLFYHDSQDLPPVVFQRMRQACTYTSDRAKIDFPVNGVEIQWTPAEVSEDDPIEDTRTLTLRLSDTMPWFDHFEIELNDDVSNTSSHDIDVHLCAGENLISVTPINDMHRRGNTSIVKLWVS